MNTYEQKVGKSAYKKVFSIQCFKPNHSFFNRVNFSFLFIFEGRFCTQGAGTQVDLPTKVSINGTCIFLCQMTWGSMFTKVILLRMDRAC